MIRIRYHYAAVSALCLLAVLVAAACAAGTPGPGGNIPPAREAGNEKYTMEQTLSDRGQQATIAFDALAFVTGDACADTFLPPGKVADYAGFQYLRDNDATQMGHNTDFVTRISDNVLFILNDDQREQFASLSQSEAPLSTQFGFMRYPLTAAFRAQLDGTYPSGTGGLDKTTVMDYSAKLYDVDASISIARAKTYASVIRSLNATQRAYLDAMKTKGMADMPVVDSSAARRNAGQDNSVAMRTYASEMFAWFAGSVEADTYFCPERQATYFGSFYMKDAPAMGNAGYSISTTLTGDSGEEFLDTLTADQRAKVTGLVDLQRADLNEIVATRTAIAAELRRALDGETIDEAKIRSLSAHYGQLDGEISYLYATHFAEVGKTLTSDQKTKAVALRNLAGYTCEGGYLYSQPIAYPADVPLAFLFGSGTYDESQMTAWLSARKTDTLQTGPGGNADREMGNMTAGGPGNGKLQGNMTWPEQGNDRTDGPGNPQQGQGAGQGQPGRMPVEEVITRLGQQGTDIRGIQAAVQAGDREAMKAWMQKFKMNNPGIAEAIEGTAAADPQAGTGGQATGGNRAGDPETPAASRNPDPVTAWFTDLWKFLLGKNTPPPVPVPATPTDSLPATVMARVPAGNTPATPAPDPTTGTTGSFTLDSAAGSDGGTLPPEYSCDGSGTTPALSWSGAPAGTREFALMMTTIPVDGSTRWNWVLYHIPGSATGIAKNGSTIGVLGTGSHGTVRQYDPPCLQGPGAKTYTITLYALSASPDLPGNATAVTGPVLTNAIAPVALGRASVNLSYSRP